jgi:hypothetical protein
MHSIVNNGVRFFLLAGLILAAMAFADSWLLYGPEGVLNILFQREDIIDDKTGDVYLRRWFLFPRDPKIKGTARIYLHKFFRGDKDRHFHDHPWPFRSLILRGGYWEHRLNPVFLKWKQLGLSLDSKHAPEPTLRIWYGPGSYLKRGARWTHRVELPEGKTAWTIVRTGVKERDWGFHTPTGWCLHSNYQDGECR